MASFIYLSFFEDQAKGQIDTDTDTYRMMLVSSSYTPNQDTHTRRSDITNEISGTGYTAGGPTCTVTLTKNATTNRIVYTFGGIALPTSTLTGRRGIVYKSRGGASSADELVFCNDFGANIVTSAQTFTVAPSVIEIAVPAP
jgi:hypothetical protein